MSPDQILSMVLRALHLIAASTALGGMVFARFAFVPALNELEAGARERLHEAVRSRWAKFVHVSILFLLLSGLYNFGNIIKTYQLMRPYHMLFGIKFLLALVVFAVASILAGRSGLAQKLRQNAKTWLNLNLVLIVSIIFLSGVLKNVRERSPLKSAPAAAAVVEPAK